MAVDGQRRRGVDTGAVSPSPSGRLAAAAFERNLARPGDIGGDRGAPGLWWHVTRRWATRAVGPSVHGVRDMRRSTDGGRRHPFAGLVLLVSVTGLLAVLSNRLSARIKVPAPLFFLIGAAMAARLFPDLHTVPHQTVERLVTVALVLILFDGGLGIGWKTPASSSRRPSSWSACWARS